MASVKCVICRKVNGSKLYAFYAKQVMNLCQQCAEFVNLVITDDGSTLTVEKLRKFKPKFELEKMYERLIEDVTAQQRFNDVNDVDEKIRPGSVRLTWMIDNLEKYYRFNTNLTTEELTNFLSNAICYCNDRITGAIK